MRLRYGLWIVLLSLLSLPQTLYGQSVVVPVSSANWFFSPFNWNVPGTVHIDNPGSGLIGPDVSMNEIVTNQPGAYFTLSFANSTQAVLDLDMNGIPSAGGTTSLAVQWRIDGTLSPVHTLTLSDARLTLAAGLSTGAHTVQFWLVSSDIHQDRWSKTTVVLGGYLAPPESLRITGMTLDPGVTVSAPAGLRPKRILFYGDSITEGIGATPANDATQTYAVTCARLLNAEYGIVGNAGQGWTHNTVTTTDVPLFGDAFSLYYAQTPRFPLVTGGLAPDYVIVNMGTNDSVGGSDPGLVAANALAWMQQIRNFMPSTQIFLLVPFGGFQEQVLQSAYMQYLLAHPTDTKFGLLDLGPTAQTGLTVQIPGGTAQSYDGIHPNLATHAALGFQLAAAVKTALGSSDFNGDGKSDLILQNIASNQIADWFQNDAVVQNGAFVPSVPDSDYQVVGSGDFNGDGKPDYVFQNRRTGQIALWYMNGTTLLGGGLVALTPASGYTVVGIGDFNGDGKPDIVFQNQTTNQIAVWFMDGSTVIGGGALDAVPAAGYQVVGVGDFNRDGQTDLLFQNTNSGVLVLWYMNGVQYVGGEAVSAVPQAGFHVEAIADFDGDGRPDVVLRDSNGNIVIWHLDGAYVYSTEQLSVSLDPAFRIAGPR